MEPISFAVIYLIFKAILFSNIKKINPEDFFLLSIPAMFLYVKVMTSLGITFLGLPGILYVLVPTIGGLLGGILLSRDQ